MAKSIKQLPNSQRPREKLLSQGVENLSTSELLAIILGSGNKNENVLTLARKILRNSDSLQTLSKKNIDELVKIKGIGPAQASKIMASFELGIRIATPCNQAIIVSPSHVLTEISDISYKPREHLIALYLNVRHQLIKKTTLAIGSLNHTILEPRDIFAEAMTLPCRGIILAHNHPSGATQPSSEDLTFTKQIVQAGKLLGIFLIDHLIVAGKNYFSMQEQGLID